MDHIAKHFGLYYAAWQSLQQGVDVAPPEFAGARTFEEFQEEWKDYKKAFHVQLIMETLPDIILTYMFPEDSSLAMYVCVKRVGDDNKCNLLMTTTDPEAEGWQIILMDIPMQQEVSNDGANTGEDAA